MALKFVAGSSGAGKSYQVYSQLVEESIRHPEKQYLVIVPEQFTMQTQKEIVTMHPSGGLLNLDILSFNRLAYRVFEETGGNTLPVLEELGKSLVLQRVVNEHREELQILGRTLSRPASITQMKSLVSELMQYQIRPQDLETWTDSGTIAGRLSLKIEDIRTIFEAFHRYIAAHYLTAEEVPQLLCDVIAQSALVRGSVIVLDGFTGFTPVQNKVIRELLVLAEDVTVVMTVDSAESLEKSSRMEQHLFHMTGVMFRKLTDMARELRVPISPVTWIKPGEKSRFSENRELQYLEAHLFRSGRTPAVPNDSIRLPKSEQTEAQRTGIQQTEVQQIEVQQTEVGQADVQHTEAQHTVSITECSSMEGECALVVQQIHKMVRTEGYRYRDFAVVTGDLSSYGRELATRFKEEKIPYFLDEKKAVMTNPMVEFIRAAVDMNVQNYSYDSVFRFLRTGLTDFETDEIDTLENYCRALGIRGRSRYEERWVRIPRSGDPEMILYYNELREKFVDLTADLHAGFHERMGSGRRKSEVLYRFLIDQKIAEKMEAFRDWFAERGEAARAKEYEQIYEQVMLLLDKLVEVLGDEKLKMSDYQEILDAGLEEMRIGLIPPGEDQVMIGDIERTRLKRIRVLFLVGVNEGMIPRAVADKGILSEFDREILKQNQVELAPSAKEKMYQQRFYLYLSMTKPSDRLLLSYSLQSEKKEARRPSYLIGEVCRLFPQLEIRRETESDSVAFRDRLETRSGRRSTLLAEIQALPEELSDDAIMLLRHELTAEDPNRAEDSRKILLAAGYAKQDTGIGAALARDLYGETLRLSVSELEEFAGCAFRHFLDHGLHLQEREEYTFTPADFGSMMHAALENYSRLVQRNRMKWGEIAVSDQHALADQALEIVYGTDEGQMLFDTWRARHQLERIREMLYRTIWAMDIQIAHGRFRPTDFEFRISDSVQSLRFDLGDGTKLQLQGKIDRLDECYINDVHYVKIIDYKSGGKQMDLGQLYHGLQMQLMVYANAVIDTCSERNPEVRTEPAAVFYYHIDDPLADASSDDPELEILRKLRPEGYVREEKEIWSLLDEELENGESSDVIQLRLTKSGEPYKDSLAHMADQSSFETIRRFTTEKVKELGRKILQGDASINPYQSGTGSFTDSSCRFCRYRGVCAFDSRLDGYQYRKLEKLQREDALNAMRKAIQD